MSLVDADLNDYGEEVLTALELEAKVGVKLGEEFGCSPAQAAACRKAKGFGVESLEDSERVSMLELLNDYAPEECAGIRSHELDSGDVAWAIANKGKCPSCIKLENED